jgi:hypothetical protein
VASGVHVDHAMKRLVLAAIFASLASGCIVHRQHHRPRHGSKAQGLVVRDARCHPSQVWDGKQCKHKGKGQGARKHDGR